MLLLFKIKMTETSSHIDNVHCSRIRLWKNIRSTFSMTKAKAIVKYAFNHNGFEFHIKSGKG